MNFSKFSKEKYSQINKIIEDYYINLAEYIKSLPKQYINLQDTSEVMYDSIYGYLWDSINNTVWELQIKAIGYDNGLYVILDNYNVEYSEDDILNTSEDEKYYFFKSELFSTFTLYNIMEFIDQYIDENN